jgi:DNA-binding GntR family transcriptional regulator
MMHTVGHQDTPDTPGPIDRGTAATPSEQVTAIVRARITSGEYPPGSRMPSVNTLAQEFGVATRTVRKALAPLAAEGLIETRPGWGTFVAKR